MAYWWFVKLNRLSFSWIKYSTGIGVENTKKNSGTAKTIAAIRLGNRPNSSRMPIAASHKRDDLAIDEAPFVAHARAATQRPGDGCTSPGVKDLL